MEDVYKRFLGGWERRQELLDRAQRQCATIGGLRAAEAANISLDDYVHALEAGASDENIHAAVAAGILPWLYVRALKAKATHEQIMEAHAKKIAKNPAFAWGIGGSGYIDLLERGAAPDQLLVLHGKEVHPETIRFALTSGLGIAKLLEAHDRGLRDADLYCCAEAQENRVDPDAVIDAHRRGLRGLDLYSHMRSLMDP
ncbi:hypothetical protein E1281_10145 [Actinomadura sp. KC345]|uniref:hypothetical protein n=1 Tax=Actinomadura sp. KC345 TaxID=2530371 RepID=UPI00104A4895|nr:hypothetical protein [Actinomadura sp. KC345]TDC55874.1 hypothetical protein E1281_10145 [Actinomadura sp. KC345]